MYITLSLIILRARVEIPRLVISLGKKAEMPHV